MARTKIFGAKGGGGGSSFVTKPDNLRSNDSFELLFGLGSGRWKGLKNGLKSLKINKVPLENADESSNFEDIQVYFADGNPLEDQIVNFRLGGGGSVDSVNVQLTNPNSPGTPGPWITGATATVDANFIDIRFVVNQLFYQDEDGIRENTANVEIEMRPNNSGTWVNPFVGTVSNNTVYDADGFDYLENGSNYTVYLARAMFNPGGTGFVSSSNTNLKLQGKTTSSPYVKELRIAVPNEGTYENVGWEVRARLIEPDTVSNDPIQERRTIIFESIAAITQTDIGDDPAWDGLAWMQVIGKATNQFSGFPQIEGVFDTKICQTPQTTVWNPETRVYLGPTWDGSYEEHFTTDPAWQMKEFVEDPIHGIAALSPGATLDKWDALEASQYYSEQVNDGKGGTHPRFNMNLTINEPREVNETMQFLAGSVNSYIEEVGAGVWRLKVDKPETPKMLFTEDNIFGEFQYTHSDVDTRYNDWRGTFLNEDFDYTEDNVRVFDQTDIDNNGIKFTEIALVGCTNRQEALRRLMFRLRVSLNEYRSVTFVTNRVGRYISPLDTILIADGALNSDFLLKSTSRFGSDNVLDVTLQREVRLEVGVSYTIHFVTEDKETISRTVTNSAGERGDVTLVKIDQALPANVLADSPVALEATGLSSNPLSYRVISVEKSDESEDEYAISAVIIDSGKWAAMDNVSESAINSQNAEVSIDPPTVPSGGMFSIQNFSTDFQDKYILQVTWDRPASNYLDSYRVEWRLNDGQWVIGADRLRDTFFEIQNPEDGTYDFRIFALDRRGVESNPLEGEYIVDGSLLDFGGGIDTYRYPDPPPTSPTLGSLYFDAENVPYRYEGVNLFSEGNQLFSELNPLEGGGWTSVQDKNITGGIQALLDADNDGILTITEKIRIVIPENSRLQTRYDGLLQQAQAIGLSVISMTDAYNDWITLRDSLNPAWDDTTQPTPIGRDSWDATLNALRSELEQTSAIISGPTAVNVAIPATTIILRDSTQTIKSGELPRTLIPVVKRGGLNIKLDDDTSYSITPTTGLTATVNNTNGSPTKGNITITAMTGTDEEILFSVTSGGIIFGPYPIAVRTQDEVSATFSANTYSFEVPLPNGDILLFQGGTDTVPGNSQEEYTFPVAYSVAPTVQVSGNPSNTAKEGNAGLVGNPTTTKFDANNTTDVTVTMNWTAVGKK